MGTGYTRNDTANNIADGNVINASDLDGEFDAIQSAFNATTGHSHDGTTGEGPQIDTAGIANDAVTLGTKTSGNYVAAGAVSGVGLSGSAASEGATFTVTSNATDANTASTIVARDASGNFSAGTITASLTGNAATATALQTARTIAGNSFDGTANITIASTDLSDSGSIDAATLDSLDSTSFLRSDAADTKTSGDLTFSDDVKAIFGSALDGIQIYNTAAGDKFISEAGSGNLKIQGDNLYLQNSAGTENHIIAISDAAVTLHYDNAAKLATTSGGIDVTGSVTFDGGTTSADLNFDDNAKAVFGGGSDLKIYHDGLNSYIQDSGTGDLKIYAANFGMWNATGASNYMTATDGGAVTLAHAGTTKLTTTSGGINVTGEVQADSIVMNDSETIYLGNSADLRLYHDGSNSYIEDLGTGDLRIKGVDVVIQQSDGNNQIASQSGGAVSLSHNGSTKLATSSVGITVSGDVIGPASADFDIKTGSGTGDMIFYTNFGEVMRVGADGRVGIGQTATTDKLEVNGDVRAVDFNATSDERLKSNIRKIEGALDKVCQMNGMHYVLDGKEASGVIAQNVQTVAPEVVADEGEYMTVAYNQLIGYLIEAVKELKTEVEELKNGNTPSVS